MAKVYVSSTIADLKRERRAVMDWLRAARHQAVDSYLPDSDTVRDSYLDDVGTCDLYVLILGHRYGFQSAEDNPEGLSITHLEFRRAGQCGIPRIALLRTSIPDVSLSDIADPAKAALVLAFRDEVTREVRAAEFRDERGLIQGLSTGIQGELDRRPAGQVAAGRALRLAARPVFLARREGLLAELDARLTGDDGPGPQVVALCGLGGAGKTSVAVEYAHRHLGEVGVAWQFAAEDPAVLAAGFGELAAALGAREGPGDPVASVHGVLAAYPAGWLLVFDNAPDRASVQAFLPPAGPGRVLIISQNQFLPPGQALDVPVLDPEVAAEFLRNRTGDADRRAALELAGELAGCRCHRSRPPPTSGPPGEPGRRPGIVPAAAAGDAAGGGTHRVWRHGRGRRSLAFGRLEQSAPGARVVAAAGVVRGEAAPLRLLLQPREGLAGQPGPDVAPVLVPLLENELTAHAIAALRRYSLVSQAAGDWVVSVYRPCRPSRWTRCPQDWPGRGGRPPPP